jgi:Cu2+-exporting ATPase
MGSKILEKIKKKMASKFEQFDPNNTTSYDVQTEEDDSDRIANETSEYEKKVDEGLAISIASTGLASAGALIFPPLSVLSILGILYPCSIIFKTAYDNSVKERRITIELLDTISILVAVINKYFVVSTLANVAYFGAQKMRLFTEKKSRQSLINIFGKQPKMIWILKDGIEIQMPFESIRVGDTTIVNSGEPVPADGIIIHGIASIDQHTLTGESRPAEKGVGDKVFATSLLLSGRIHVLVEKSGKDTTAAKIFEILQNTTDYTLSVQSIGQEMADASVLPTLAISIAAFPIVKGRGTAALLCSNYLDNMRMGAPTSMMNFLNIASQQSILIKDGRSIQLMTEIDIIIFDKTGTLTLNQPDVKKVHSINGFTEDDVLIKAAAAEYRQSHPIAAAILDEAEKRGLYVPDINKASYKVGYGISVRVENQNICVGSHKFMEMEGIIVPDTFDSVRKNGHECGHSFIYVAIENRLTGMIELAPKIRPEVQQVIKKLKQYHMYLCIISGDDEIPTRMLAQKLGIEKYYAGVLPEKKADLVKQYQSQGYKVCFVGDGINDAIALKTANVSVSIQGASMVAMDSAQVILMDNSLKKLPELFQIAYDFQKNMHSAFFSVSTFTSLAVGGVFFMNFSIPAVTLLFGFSLTSCLIISLLPGIKNNRKVKKITNEPFPLNNKQCQKNKGSAEVLNSIRAIHNQNYLLNSANKTPLYQGLYHGPEGKELTVSLKTKPCRFNCTMCAWKQKLFADITENDILDQIKSVISNYSHRIPEVKQFSFGNEGSLFDKKTIRFETVLQITEIIQRLFPRISFETRAQFLTQDIVDNLKHISGNTHIEFTVGFETKDNDIRQKILKKGIPLKLFERKLALLKNNNVSVRIYVMLKSSPFMSEYEGVEECVKTIEYLNGLWNLENDPLTIHLNPIFIIRGSKFESMAIEQKYTAPKLWSIAEVLNRVKHFPLKIHLGLSTEGINESKKSYIFGNCNICNSEFTKRLKEYNQHHNIDRLLNKIPECDCKPGFMTF